MSRQEERLDLGRPGRRKERRQSDRYAPDWLHCSRGHVLDLSSSGLRLLATRRLSGPHQLTLWGNESSMNVVGDVMWSRRLGFRRHEVGLQFLGLDPTAAAELDEMGSGHSFRP